MTSIAAVHESAFGPELTSPDVRHRSAIGRRACYVRFDAKLGHSRLVVQLDYRFRVYARITTTTRNDEG
jgi:hypothetical protein